MKKIGTINLVTGETGLHPIDEIFFAKLRSEIDNCKSTTEEYPNIGTVKDGSNFAMQKTLESLGKKANRLADKHLIFTTFYEDILDDIDAINAICDANSEKSVKCILIGQQLGYAYVKNLIERLNKAEGVEE